MAPEVPIEIHQCECEEVHPFDWTLFRPVCARFWPGLKDETNRSDDRSLSPSLGVKAYCTSTRGMGQTEDRSGTGSGLVQRLEFGRRQTRRQSERAGCACTLPQSWTQVG